jgi:hypothetical protein
LSGNGSLSASVGSRGGSVWVRVDGVIASLTAEAAPDRAVQRAVQRLGLRRPADAYSLFVDSARMVRLADTHADYTARTEVVDIVAAHAAISA